ncbi:MAG: helix-turn-helix domain-containing protein [Clostridiales Family XIII bacterium]|nr:helix-turn-helix domain-containing protein [Clostridiales Family XIII bacterium]
MDFYKIISEERKRQGMSAYRLAKLAGVTQNAIAFWERGERSISLENADRVLTALGVEMTIGKANV